MARGHITTQNYAAAPVNDLIKGWILCDRIYQAMAPNTPESAMILKHRASMITDVMSIEDFTAAVLRSVWNS